MQSLDFEHARLIWRTLQGSVGVWRIAASATPVDRPKDRKVMTPAVIAGHVYGSDRLPLSPAYSFQVIAGGGRHIILRDYGEHQRDTSDVDSRHFDAMDIHAPTVTCHVVTAASLAAKSTLPLVAVIAAIGRDGARWILEAPVNHINHRATPDAPVFQVETGPILVPTGLIAPSRSIAFGGFTLAFLFFNRFDRVDLALLDHEGGGGIGRRSFVSWSRIEPAVVTLVAPAR